MFSVKFKFELTENKLKPVENIQFKIKLYWRKKPRHFFYTIEYPYPSTNSAAAPLPRVANLWVAWGDSIQTSAGIFQQSMGTRNRVGIGLSYRLARARICKPFNEPRNRFLAWRAGTTTLFVVSTRQASKAYGIDSSESIPGLLKRLQIQAQTTLAGGIDSVVSIPGLPKGLTIRSHPSLFVSALFNA